MTDRHDDNDTIDRLAREIRAERIDDEDAGRITDRVAERLGIGREAPRPLSSCSDFQAEIPAFVAGALPAARALLVGDHTRECIPCRRALMAARGATTPRSPQLSMRSNPRWVRAALRVAAAVILLLGGVAIILAIGDVQADRSLRAGIETIDGSLQLVEGSSSRELGPDAEIRSRQVVRTAKGSGAMLRIDDGSLVEMDQRSELEFRASRRGTTIDLARGNIIVHAADQGDRRLYVATNDCEIAVKGTIFAVDHGLKGSRVSVIEGEVEVREGASSSLLHPGDQITTGDHLRRVPLEEQIAWSRDAETHTALLRELTVMRRVIADAVDHAPPRTSTFLLDLAPGDTFIYAAMPNITIDLADARSAFYEQLESSEVLAEWWRERVVAHGIDQEINRLLDRLQPIGNAIGAEAVVAVPISIVRAHGSPLFMAELDDPESFSGLLTQMVDQANGEAGDHAVAVIVDDPLTSTPEAAEVYLWVEGDLFAATGDIEALRMLAHRVEDPGSRTFQGTALHTQLTQSYAGGVSWILGVDLAEAIAEGTSQMTAEEAETLARLGLLDATTVVVERHRDGDWYATNAEVRFSGPRRGLMAWLAEPAPMGSLEFVSPDAYVAASAVTKDAAEMLDDLLELVSSEDANALDELRLFEDRIGIDLREDLAAAFGGEATFALDGPMLPKPSWKLIVEVYDPGTVVHSVERAVDMINNQLTGQGDPEVLFVATEGSGRTFYTLSREGLDGQAVFTILDGYLVAAPSRALIEQAISYRESGVTLATSSTFRALLPDNGYTDCSALVYRDLGSLTDAVPKEMRGELEFADALRDDLSRGLVCVFGEPDRITASATGDSLVGLASTLGMCGAAHAEKNMVEGAAETEAVSSL